MRGGGFGKGGLGTESVTFFSLNRSVTQQQHSGGLQAAGKHRLMFELKPAIVYHPWHFSAVQTGQLHHIESNNEKNATLFFFPVNQENGCQHLLVLRAVKTRAEMSNNNYAVRGV